MKLYPTSLDDLLEPYPPGAPERQAFEVAYALASSLGLLSEPASGFGLMAALELAEIRLHDGRVFGREPFILGIQELAELCAVLFPHVHRNPIWWKSRYPSEITNPMTKSAAKLIMSRLRESELVEELRE